MFILKQRHNVALTAEERVFIWRKCRQLGISIDGVTIWRNKGLSWKDNVACFSIKHPDNIYIANDQKNLIYLLPHLCHELKHREQYYRNKALYILRAIPFLRKFLLEKEAYAEEDRIRDLLQYP